MNQVWSKLCITYRISEHCIIMIQQRIKCGQVINNRVMYCVLAIPLNSINEVF